MASDLADRATTLAVQVYLERTGGASLPDLCRDLQMTTEDARRALRAVGAEERKYLQAWQHVSTVVRRSLDESSTKRSAMRRPKVFALWLLPREKTMTQAELLRAMKFMASTLWIAGHQDAYGRMNGLADQIERSGVVLTPAEIKVAAEHLEQLRAVKVVGETEARLQEQAGKLADHLNGGAR